MPAEAIFSPSRAASIASSLRSWTTCCRAEADVVANLRAKLDDRLMHLRFDALFQKHLAVRQNLLDVRTQLARLRIDDLEFLFDAESEDVIFRANPNGGTASLKKSSLLVGRRTQLSGRMNKPS